MRSTTRERLAMCASKGLPCIGVDCAGLTLAVVSPEPGSLHDDVRAIRLLLEEMDANARAAAEMHFRDLGPCGSVFP
jgi:hypothetical protein